MIHLFITLEELFESREKRRKEKEICGHHQETPV
jgi:hypothetical protein